MKIKSVKTYYYKFSKKFINSKAFTLIEILVVVTIIGILAAIAFVNFNESQKKSRDARRISDIGELVKAVQLYHEKFNAFPDNVLGTESRACYFPYYSGFSATVSLPGCLAGSGTKAGQTTHGLVDKGIILDLPKDPKYPKGAYAYFGYPIDGADLNFKPNLYAMLHADLEYYHGSSGVAGSFRYPESGNWCAPTDNYEYCIRILP